MRHWLCVSLIFACVPLFAHAQFGGSLLGAGAGTLESSPRLPQPFEPVTVELNDAGAQLQGATIEWRLNGEPLQDAAGRRSLELTAPDAGEITTVEAVLTTPSGGVTTAVTELRPVYLDLVVEAQTRTPAFYRGRALPSSGSTVRLIALMHGHSEAPDDLFYRWEIAGDVFSGGPLRGQNIILTELPLGLETTIDIEVFDLSNTRIAERRIALRLHEPDVSFYEVSSLYGMLPRAINGPQLLSSGSLTVQAEPYHLDLATFNDPDLIEWEVDNQPRSVSRRGNPYRVTLERRFNRGGASVDFHVRNLDELVHGARGSLTITY